MSNRYKGAVISATPPSVQSGPGAAFAPGIWTTSQQMQYQAAGTWPLTYDPNFNQTVLLLHGDGTNGAQNNTFLDSSTNNFTITRNGNTTQGTFTPFSLPNGQWSNFFDGNGDSLSVPSSTAFELDGDFTIEMWIYKTKSTGAGEFDGLLYRSADWRFKFQGSNNIINYDNGTDAQLINYTGAIPMLNNWHHLAFVRSGSTLTGYVDGASYGSVTASGSFTASGSALLIGDNGFFFGGYISNLRIVKGTAVYTSNFTPSTSPLTAITNTSLLTCQSNRFVDNSTNNFAITRNGDVSVQPFSPFAPSAAYSPSVNGGSGYFDGSGDYLTAPSDASLTTGTGDCTIEAWVYSNVSGPIVVDSASNAVTSIYIQNAGGNKAIFGAANYPGSGISIIITTSNSVPANAWTHVALVRNSGTFTVYINGVSGGTAANTTNSFELRVIGALIQSGNPLGTFNGYISNARIVKGTAVYTAAFTPPTAPLTNITNTSLLLNYTNAGIFDNTGKNNLETVADAQIDTSVKKYGTGSLEFDGNGDWLFVRPTPDNQVGSGDFTVEGWFYANSPVPQFGYKMFSQTGAGTNFFVITAGEAGGANTNVVSVIIDNTVISSTATFTTGTWNHFAVVRSSGDVKVYLNGSGGSATTKTTNIFNLSYNIGIGSNPTNSNEQFNGYLDDFRITKGIARYTANFTPPNGPFFNT